MSIVNRLLTALTFRRSSGLAVDEVVGLKVAELRVELASLRQDTSVHYGQLLNGLREYTNTTSQKGITSVDVGPSLRTIWEAANSPDGSAEGVLEALKIAEKFGELEQLLDDDSRKDLHFINNFQELLDELKTSRFSYAEELINKFNISGASRWEVEQFVDGLVDVIANSEVGSSNQLANALDQTSIGVIVTMSLMTRAESVSPEAVDKLSQVVLVDSQRIWLNKITDEIYPRIGRINNSLCSVNQLMGSVNIFPSEFKDAFSVLVQSGEFADYNEYVRSPTNLYSPQKNIAEPLGAFCVRVGEHFASALAAHDALGDIWAKAFNSIEESIQDEVFQVLGSDLSLSGLVNDLPPQIGEHIAAARALIPPRVIDVPKIFAI